MEREQDAQEGGGVARSLDPYGRSEGWELISPRGKMFQRVGVEKVLLLGPSSQSSLTDRSHSLFPLLAQVGCCTEV